MIETRCMGTKEIIFEKYTFYDEKGNTTSEIKVWHENDNLYYENGNVNFERRFIRGNLHGSCKIYNEDGTLNETRHYQQNMMTG